MNYKDEYKKKLMSADEAMSVISSGDVVDYGHFNSKPIVCDIALAKRAAELQDVSVYGSGCVMPIPEISNYPESFTFVDWHWAKTTRTIKPPGRVFSGPMMFQRLGWYIKNYDTPFKSIHFNDAAKTKNIKSVTIFQVCPMDKHGYFNFGPMPTILSALVEAADIIIVEINKNMPHCIGIENSVHISQVHRIVEAPDDQKLPEAFTTEPTDVERKIANFIMPHIHDGCCLQLGIGGMPNLIGGMIVDSDLKDLGGHTELFVESFMKMILAGKMTGRKKAIDRNLCTYAFALGTQEMYDFMHLNHGLMAYPASYTNSHRTIAQLDNFISINNALHIDLFSQVSAESLVENGITRQISGNGGMLDFVLGSHESNNGKSFITISSTFTDKDGQIHSRIVPVHTPGTIVTTPRHAVDYIVTEFGVERLAGCPTWMRTEKLINIAHPNFRDELIKEAERMGIWRQSNKI